MCILCVIQKWSRRVATMLPWLVIPLIGLWALSQLLPPAFRFEITSPRLACVFVLLMTLFWYEILMPQLSAWRVRRTNRLREKKRFEAIEMQKLRKTATRKCRNCLTPYRDQNPGGGKFMCFYCGHASKRPVLDLPVPPGLGISNSGFLKDLVGKGGKILNGKAWSDNGWICGQDWLDSGNFGGSFPGKSGSWNKNGSMCYIGDHCLTEKSYSRIFVFACKAFTAFFLSMKWLWRKIFRVASSSNDALTDAEHRALLEKRGENGSGYQVSRGEKARKKAEEKRQARLEKEQMEEEERKQREEVAKLVEERRKLRDEKDAEKDRGKGSPGFKERDGKKEAERKRQEKKKERDRGSSKSNSDVEEVEKRVGKENERNKRNETDRREYHRTGPESTKMHGTDGGHGFKGTNLSNHSRGNAGTRYLDRMRGTILSSSRAFTGGGFFGKTTNTASASRENKSNASVDHIQTFGNRRELLPADRVSGRPNVNGDDKNIGSPVLVEPQSSAAPKKSWQQLFTRSSPVSSPSNSSVIGRPSGKSQSELHSPTYAGCPPAIQTYDNPISFGLPSPFTSSTFPFGQTNSSVSLPLSSDAMFPRIGETQHQLLPKESEKFEDPCYIPDPISLLGPVSESLDSFQLDLGFVSDIGLENPGAEMNFTLRPEVNRLSPIESPMSRMRVSEEKLASPFPFPSTPKAKDIHGLVGSNGSNDAGTWQMWNSSPLGQDGLNLIGASNNWLLHSEGNRPKKEDALHTVPQKTMASLFRKNDQVISGPPQMAFPGSYQNGGPFNAVAGSNDGLFANPLFGTNSGGESQISVKPNEETDLNELVYGTPSSCAASYPFELSSSNFWAKKDWNEQDSREAANSSVNLPHVGGQYSFPSVQSVWSSYH